MTLSTRLASIALLATVAFGSAAPAMAHHVDQPHFNEAATLGLLQVVRSVGVQVVVDDPTVCRKGLMGQAMMSADGQRQALLICAKNHGSDLDELADTVRHESIHVAQHCRARNLGIPGSSPILPNQVQGNIRFAADHLHMPLKRYPTASWPAEAEARVGAQAWDEKDVAFLVRRYCK